MDRHRNNGIDVLNPATEKFIRYEYNRNGTFSLSKWILYADLLGKINFLHLIIQYCQVRELLMLPQRDQAVTGFLLWSVKNNSSAIR